MPDAPSGMTLSIEGVGDYARIFRLRAIAIIKRMPDALAEVNRTLQAASPTGRPKHFLGIAIFAGLLLVLGRAVAELFLAYLARPVFVRMQRPNPSGIGEKLPVLVVRLILTIITVVIICLVATGVGVAFYDGHAPTLITALVVFGTYGAIMIAHTFWRVVLSPFLPDYRLPAIGDRPARRLYRWMTAASVAGIGAAAFSHWIEALGLPREVLVIVTLSLTLLAMLALVAALRANYRAITAILSGGLKPDAEPPSVADLAMDAPPRRPTWLQRLVAIAWAPVAILFMLVTWGDLVFRMVMGIDAGAERIIAPFTVLVATMAVYSLVLFAADRVFSRGRRIRQINAEAAARAAAEEAAAAAEATAAQEAAESADGAPALTGDAQSAQSAHSAQTAQSQSALPSGVGPYPRTDGGSSGQEGEASDEDGATGGPGVSAPSRRALAESGSGGMRTFEDLAFRIASLLAIGTGLWLVIWYWGGVGMFAENALFGIVEDVIDVVLIGYVVFHATRIWLDQKIMEEVGEEDPNASIMDGEGGGAGATRLATLLPLIRNLVLSVITISVALLVAIEMGVNVAPLFAGAGIVGIAIGFGAQTLVRDIISGAFFLLDDAFRKGEYIDVGTVKGTVEKISARSFQLRHHLGMLHTIPFGEIQYLTNFSRDWVMMKLPLRLTYDTDVEKVRKLVKKLGIKLLEDPAVGHLFLQPLKSQGVIMMEDSAMIVRVKFMTRPGDQWVTRKKVYAEIRDLFEREGIKFAHREVTVRIPEEVGGKPVGEEQREAI
ncbi:MAG: mechanosensitive ion channel family protein, partial [Pseudomonadota bacterium]